MKREPLAWLQIDQSTLDEQDRWCVIENVRRVPVYDLDPDAVKRQVQGLKANLNPDCFRVRLCDIDEPHPCIDSLLDTYQWDNWDWWLDNGMGNETA